jgi:hypothetical protein
LPYFLPPSGRPYGWQDPKQWTSFGAWMRDQGLIKTGALGAQTNRFLPGAGLD